MKKLLFLLLSLASLSSCQASFLDARTPLDKCIGAATLLLGTLSTLDDLKERNSVAVSISVLSNLKKDLQKHKEAQELYNAVNFYRYDRASKLLQDKEILDINARFTAAQLTSLMMCCIDGSPTFDIAKEILKHPKLDITIKSISGRTCLHYVCYYRTFKIGGLLLARKDIDKIINQKSGYKKTPLDYLFSDITTYKGSTERVNFWCKMVRQGAVLSKYKEDYNKLKFSNDIHSDGIEDIKDNPPKDIEEESSESKER